MYYPQKKRNQIILQEDSTPDNPAKISPNSNLLASTNQTNLARAFVEGCKTPVQRQAFLQQVNSQFGNQQVQRLVKDYQANKNKALTSPLIDSNANLPLNPPRPSSAKPEPQNDTKSIQRMVIPLGDLASLNSKNKSSSDEAEAKIITEGKTRLLNKPNKAAPIDPQTNQYPKHTEARLEGIDAKVIDEKGPLSKLGENEKLYIFGHGGGEKGKGEPITAMHVYDPEALANLLVAAGLSEKYKGEIYLNGCNTGSGLPPDSYANKFQVALAKYKRYVSVKANKGFATVREDGSSAVTDQYEEAKKVSGITFKIEVELLQLEKATNIIDRFQPDIDELEEKEQTEPGYSKLQEDMKPIEQERYAIKKKIFKLKKTLKQLNPESDEESENSVQEDKEKQNQIQLIQSQITELKNSSRELKVKIINLTIEYNTNSEVRQKIERQEKLLKNAKNISWEAENKIIKLREELEPLRKAYEAGFKRERELKADLKVENLSADQSRKLRLPAINPAL